MLKKIIIWLFVVIILFTGGLFTFLYFNQDYLTNQLVSEINKRLKVPVNVATITISPLSSFPDATIHFSNVKIQDPEHADISFAKADNIGFSFNLWQLIKGDMVLEEISISHAEVNIIRYNQDKWSYHIYKELEESANSSLSLNIKKLRLNSVKATYSSFLDSIEWTGAINNALASIRLQGPVTWININANLVSESLTIKEYKTLNNQPINIDAEIVADDHWRISTDKLYIGDSDFRLTANKNDESILIDLDATKATIQTLLDLAPVQVKKRLENYKSKGNITLSTKWKYSFDKGITSMSGTTVFDNVEINQTNPNLRISSFFLNGKVRMPDINDLSGSTVQLQSIIGNINDSPFSADLEIQNFEDPFLLLSYQGNMPLHLLTDLANLELKEPSGSLQINLSIEGKTEAMKDARSLKNVKASGDIILSNIYFLLPDRPYALDAITGNIILNNDHIAINDLDLQLGDSRFNVNGQLRNFWNITSENPWSATADVYSSNLNLDELLSAEDKKENPGSYNFNIPENIKLELNAHVDALAVRKFKATKIVGKINVAEGALHAEKLTFESMGGLVKLKGNWKDLNSKGSEIKASFLLSGIEAGDLFYSFENFGQSFITNKNLSGNIYADVETSLRLDYNFIFIPSSLTAILNTKIINGKLKDFEPLNHLEKYFNDADLSQVEFGELENKIFVQDQKVHLPLMPVGTNIIKFKLGGTHTFDQHIDYNVVAPIIRKQKVDKDGRFGEIAEDQHGESLIFLNIVGTTDDFEVSLDKRAMKQEVVSDVKKEIKDLQDAFNNKGKTTEEVKLEEDAYFDWDEEEN